MSLKKPHIHLTQAKVLSNFIIAYCVSILGIADGILQIRNANRSKHNRGVKRAWGGFQIGTSALLMGGTLVSHVSSVIIKNQNVVAPLSRIAIQGASGFAYAAYAWGLLIKAGYDLHKTIKKTDMTYLYEDKIKKMAYLKEILQTYKDIDGTEQITQTYDRLKRQAIAIEKTIPFIAKDTIITKNKLDPEAFSFLLSNNELNAEEKKYIDHLKARQQTKVAKQWYDLSYSALFAIGMTLTAISAFVPAVFFLGLAITLVSTLLKYTPLIYNFLNNRFAASYEKKYLANKQVTIINTNAKEDVFYLSLKEQQALEEETRLDNFGFFGKMRKSSNAPKIPVNKQTSPWDFLNMASDSEKALLKYPKK